MASHPVTGNGSFVSSYSTRPTSCLSCSRSRLASRSCGVRSRFVSLVVVIGGRVPRGGHGVQPYAVRLRRMCEVVAHGADPVDNVSMSLDDLDRRLVTLFTEQPQI